MRKINTFMGIKDERTSASQSKVKFDPRDDFYNRRLTDIVSISESHILVCHQSLTIPLTILPTNEKLLEYPSSKRRTVFVATIAPINEVQEFFIHFINGYKELYRTPGSHSKILHKDIVTLSVAENNGIEVQRLFIEDPVLSLLQIIICSDKLQKNAQHNATYLYKNFDSLSLSSSAIRENVWTKLSNFYKVIQG